ncbi:argininosuccinate lyase [Anaerolineales bacterium HSG24]|nr:argininosuccinate lyase [Anaerolineales bacterium HSG24]
MSKLWGGRFTGVTDTLMSQFQDSIYFDVRLWQADITGSIAYAKALARAGVISDEESKTLQQGLAQVQAEFAEKRFELKTGDEDIHTAVERRLTEIVGEVGGKLHTGRSRNDQIATDLRLWLKAEIEQLRRHLVGAQWAIISKAEEYVDVILPGYTHLQQAQPVRFSHWLLSFGWMLERDKARLDDLTRRVDVMPLGSGAMAGNPMGIDRLFLADELGFATISANSMDGVSDRDYLIEFLSWASILQVHLSRLAEDLIIYSSQEFNFVELADAYSTGSSIMPQKKNPDSMELIRGKTGRVIGSLVGLLTTLKGLPSTYNKDLQEDKESVFDTVDTLTMTLQISRAVIQTLTVNDGIIYDKMDSTMLATELANYLSAKGMPFREAHHIVGQVVQKAIDLDQPLNLIPVAVYQQFSDLFEHDMYKVLTFHRAADRHTSSGGTGKQVVRDQLDALKLLTEFDEE